MMDVKRSDFDGAVRKLLGAEAYESTVVLPKRQSRRNAMLLRGPCFLANSCPTTERRSGSSALLRNG